MDYEKFFERKLDDLQKEGRYRIFADLERRRGGTQALLREGDQNNDVTVWCTNDYLGMGQNQEVLEAMHDALELCGAGAGDDDCRCLSLDFSRCEHRGRGAYRGRELAQLRALARKRHYASGIPKVEQTARLRHGAAAWAWGF